MIRLHQLPPEVLFRIFDHLCTWRLEALSDTCKDLNQAVHDYERIFKLHLRSRRLREKEALCCHARKWCATGFLLAPSDSPTGVEGSFRYTILALMDAYELDPAFHSRQWTKPAHLGKGDPWPSPWLRPHLFQFLQFSPHEHLVSVYLGTRRLSEILQAVGLAVCEDTGAMMCALHLEKYV